MRKIITLSCALMALVACNKKDAPESNVLKIRGKVKHTGTGMVVLKEIGDTNVINLDSVALDKDGLFSFKISPKEKTFYYVDLLKKQTVFLIGGAGDTLYIEADGDSQQGAYSVRGSKDNEQVKQAADLIKSYQEEFNKQQQNYMVLIQQGKTEEAQQLVSGIGLVYDQKINEAKQMIRGFGSGLPAMSLAANFISPEKDLLFLDSLAQKLQKDLPSSKHTKSFVEFVERNKELNIGSPAPDFTAATPDGNWVKLSDLKGKYVLLDFWASWCGPCRQENPNVVKLYNAYKDKNFTILSYSLDENKADWTKAIAKDGLTWTHVSELRKWESKIVPLYKLEGIPATFLLDKEGKIIAKNLRGDQLAEKLKEVLK